jgi:hypothetical protein
VVKVGIHRVPQPPPTPLRPTVCTAVIKTGNLHKTAIFLPASIPFDEIDVHDLWRNGALYVHRILKGAKAGDLPAQLKSKLELVVNLKTAKALDPPSLSPSSNRLIR